MNTKSKKILKYVSIFAILYIPFQVSLSNRSHIAFNKFTKNNQTLSYFISLLTFNILVIFLIKKSIIGYNFYLILISFNVIDAVAMSDDIANSHNDNYFFYNSIYIYLN
ncbi:hypothetical protein [Peptoniphilus rhinitidis]|uniref:hypothetical protein n=1 Tax=Peptoniphilus rhinitidis TaxID=1175452 RepID=UPI000289D553|nr:hypothetical protein [Peptoniphilus rhinitidis]